MTIHCIMSDLAKFVAATLQEQVAVDLEEEIKALRKENERLEAMLEAERTKTLEYASRNGRVEITGKDGAPVYAHLEMKDPPELVTISSVGILEQDPMLCPITKLKEAEIRLNGLLVATLSECDESQTLIEDPVDPDDPDCFTRVYMFNSKTHDVGGLWDNKTFKLHVMSQIPALRGGTPEEVTFEWFELDEEAHE